MSKSDDSSDLSSPSEALAATMVDTGSADAFSQASQEQLVTGQTGAHVVDGRYRLVALLGQGGMGNVYKAKDLELDEIVALKTLKKELVHDEKAVERFRAEVRLARRVTHRHVARTFDLGMCGNIPYLTMEFIDGEDLATLLVRERRLSVERFMRLARPVCEGLASAHAVGVVHRDLKPQNVIVAADGRVVLTDFGIARASQRDSQLTAEGVPLGTPAYMAPEQVQGDIELDHRADIYALGVMFFEMLTGRLPFVGNTPVSTALARLLEEVPDLREFRADVPDEIVGVVDRCLAKDREERYGRVDELLEALDSVVPPPRAPGPVEASTPAQFAAKTTGALGEREDGVRGATAGARRFTGTSQGARQGLKAVAVLPFRHGGNDDDVYVADGLTEDLIDELSLSKSLKVRPRGAVMRFKQTERPPREIGQSLGVHVIVDGSIRRAGDRIRVRVGLVSVEDGFQIWAKRFKGTSADLFDISEKAARAIVEALTADELATPQPAAADSGAVDLYLKARHEMHASWFGDLSLAVDLFEKALAQAPDDSRVLSGAALAHARATFYEAHRRHEHFSAALDYANQALDIAPNRPEPRLALARVHFDRLDYRAALETLREAIALAPSNADAHELLGRILREIGPLDAATHHLETALELNPYSNARWDLATAYALSGNWAKADELLDAEVEGENLLNIREATRTRIDTWRDEPRWMDEGEARPVSTLSPPIRYMCEYRRELLRTGQVTDEHRAYHRQAREMSVDGTRFRLVVHQLGAEVFAYAGEADAAIGEIEQAIDAGFLDLMWLEACNIFAAIRDDPRFEACRRRVAQRIEKIRA